MTLSKFNDDELPHISDGLFANSLVFGSGTGSATFQWFVPTFAKPFQTC